MARDASGVYSQPASTSAVSGQTISSTAYNDLITDIVADLNLARPVVAGGTGRSTLTSNMVLVGNGTGLVNISKAAPAGAFVGTTDVQTLTSKTLTSPTMSDPTMTGTSTIADLTVTGTITLPAGGLETADLADDSVTLAKMAHGTDGNLITYDASGAPAYVATGTANQVLVSNGPGAAPSFQAVPGQTFESSTRVGKVTLASALSGTTGSFSFSSPFSGTPTAIVFQPANGSGAGAQGLDVTALSASGFSVSVSNYANNGTATQFYYIAIRLV